MKHAAPVLHQSSGVTREWTQRALGRPVLSFERSEALDSNWGSHVRLRISLEGERVPRSLHLKIASVATFGRAEIDYYTRDFVGLTDAPLVRCHHADADATHYNLLMDDLAETHRDQKAVAPTESYGRALVEAAARLHAYRGPQAPPAPSLLEGAFASGRAGEGALLEAMREGFTAEERATARELLSWCPGARLARLADPEGMTWIHGDLNPTNVLAPIHGDGPLYLIDHQPFAVAPLLHWLGVSDVAYAIVVWWPAELRRECERRLVEHWHAALVRRGVEEYSLAKAWEDWRLCGLHGIHVAANWCSSPESALGMRGLWEAQLRRVLAFAEDHPQDDG